MPSYRGVAAKLLESARADVGDKIRVELKRGVFEGILMPRPELADDKHLVLKLSSGYNIGIHVKSVRSVQVLEKGRPPEISPPSPPQPSPSLPRVAILGTGGTIASRVDYRTGAVYPAFTAGELYSIVPELAGIANIEVAEVCRVFSEHMTPKLWVKIGKEVARAINRGARGVVVAHGTDTMAYTAAALSFMLKGLFRPVALVGSQRSSDRPSSDAALNLISAVTFAARSDVAEVVVVMHGSMSDDICLVHRGTKVRKCHTSRRDAFVSVNRPPLAVIKDGEVELLERNYRRAGEKGRVRVDGKFEPRVVLIKATPGYSSDILEAAVDLGYRGIVIEGTGLGHAPETMFAGIKRAIERDIPVVMTSQCIWGRINMRVYSTGRDLLSLGVIPGEDMLPETALVKLMYVLGRTRKMEKVRELMLKNLAGEISERSPSSDFPRGHP
jgi:glutamyl-tRNA(Gln) amidotransferase subunit D